MNPDRIYFKNREVAAYRLLDVLPIDSMKLEDWTVIASSYGGFEIVFDFIILNFLFLLISNF